MENSGIDINGVSKSFGSQKVLQNLSLSIPSGKVTAIVGPSGAGKSVLLKLILGLLSPEEGSINLLGHEVTKAKTEREKTKIRKRCGVLFQSAALIDSISLFDNVAFPLREHKSIPEREIRSKVLHLFEELSLTDVAKHLPQQVSLGVRKRAGIARAMILEPEILLVDEPNTGLDPLYGQEVYDLIKSFKERCGFTGVVISHEIPEVFQVSDRVAMIFQGKIFAEGTPAEIKDNKDPYVQQFLQGSVDGPIRIQ